jgi:5-methylcytosine-specific restriction endonuclease McrA
MCYNSSCLNKQSTGALFIPEAALATQNLSISGKAPSMCGLTSLAVCLGNGSAHGGHFVMETKKCSRCKKVKSTLEFSKRKSSKDGFDFWCKQCNIEGRDREKNLLTKRAYRIKHAEEIRQARIDYYNQHVEEASERAKKYYQENRERLVAHAAKYRDANRELINEKRRKRHKENRDGENQYHRIWSKSHPEVTRLHNRIRRVRLNNVGGNFTAEQFEELCVKYGGKCLACGEIKLLSPDHIIPISKGGGNDISNIQPLCSSCNGKKHAKTIDYRTKADAA